jgi:1-phosphatidylinositol phosphodiesterase
MPITEQLNAGIRYLDLRCGLIYNQLIMFHGLYNLGFTLKEAITDIQSWLTSHPTEAVIVQIKEDPDPTDSTISFAAAVEKLILGPSGGRWNTSATLPRLQDIRNHMQLVRRYSVNETAGEKAIGIDLSQGWEDNNPSFSFLTPSKIKIVAQDQYKYDERLDVLVSHKFIVLDALMEDAADDSVSTTWYINFASATHAAPTGIFPNKIAVGGYAPGSSLWVPGINTRLRNKLYGLPTHKRYGTILMDYPESPDGDLIARIVADNM